MKRSGLLTLLLLLGALLLLATPMAEAASKKKRKAWTQAELDALEKQWEDGDAEEELQTPERERRIEMEEREKAKKEGKEMPPMGGAGMNNGPAMMFVDLLPHKAPDGMAWKPKDIDLLNRRWTQMTLSGGVQAQFYNLDDKILATFDRKLTNDVNEFLFDQHEVDFLTLDSRQIFPPNRKQ